MHLKSIPKGEIWVWICFQHFIQGNFCWWTTTVCLWRVTPSKLFRRRPKSGGNCKYTTFPGTHAPNRSGQQEGGELSQRRDPPTVPLLSSSASGQLDSSITRSAGICHPGHFYSGICYLEIFIFGMTFMALSSSLCMKTLKLKVTVSKFSC